MTEIARKAVRIARFAMMSDRADIVVRDFAITALSEAAPALFPRSFDGITDRRPPQRPYASGEARVGN